MVKTDWISKEVLDFLSKRLEYWDLIDSFSASLTYSFENNKILSFEEEMIIWEETVVFALTKNSFRGNLDELLDALYKYCQKNINALPVFDRVCILHYDFEQLDKTREFQKTYRNFIALKCRKSIKENHRILKEITTSKVINNLAKRLNSILNAPENFDTLIKYLKNVAFSADSEEGIVSDDSAIQKKGERLETDEQFYNLLRSACNAEIISKPRKVFELIWNNKEKIDNVVGEAIRVGNLRAANNQFDAKSFWEEVKAANQIEN